MKRCFLLLPLLMFALAIGCEKGRGLPVNYVEGVVLFDGEPLEGATITFVPKTESKDIEAAAGRTDASGKYTLTSMNGDPGKGALAGEYVVLVNKLINLSPPGFNPADPTPPPTKRVTPIVYNDRLKSPLNTSVVKGKNKCDFELKSKP